MEPFISRLLEFQKRMGLSNNAFATQCGINPSNYTKMLRGNQTFTTRSLVKIGDAFPNLNTEWLMTGDGEMLNKSKQAETDTVSHNDNTHKIPFYDAETTGGYQGLVSSSNENASICGYINAGDWFDGRETAAIRHVGDSMVEYPDGCVLAVREVHELRLLVPGRNYVIETNEYRVTKRVQKGSTNDCIALYSTNQEKYDDGRLVYEPFEVYFEDVRRIFSILGYIVNQAGETRLIKAF